MRAAILERHGGPEVLRLAELPVPHVQAGQVLLRVRACGLNRGLDGRTRENGAGRQITLPHILGTEVVGDVAALGPGTERFKAGDVALVIPWSTCGACPECAAGRENGCALKRLLGIDRPGGYAEYLAVDEDRLVSLPAGRPLEEPAALPISFTTAWHMLKSRARLRQGESVLVLGAAGAVGLAAVQLARHLGARVIAAASSAEKRATARRMGADEVIDYGALPAFSPEVKRLTGGRGADVVVEHVGASTWEESLRSLAPSGRLAMCGATTGHELRFDARELWRRNVSLLFSNAGTDGELREVVRLWIEGRIRPCVAEALPLDQVVEAHRLLARRDLIGKVVLKL